MSPNKRKATTAGIGFGVTGFHPAARLVVFVALAAATYLSPGVGAQEVKEGPGAAETMPKVDETASREILQAVQKLRAAVQGEKKGELKVSSPLPSRPERKVIPP